MIFFTLSLSSALVVGLIVALALSVFWYLISIIRDRNDVADIGWSTYFIAIALMIYAIFSPVFDLRLVPIFLVIVWGVRLSTHIAARHSHHGEDPRYLAWRAAWGAGLYFRIRSYLQVFLLQSVLAFIISLPLIILGTYGVMHLSLLIIGTVIWIFGFAFEATADAQLAAYLKNTKTPGICRTGLWNYSRHPNYFGEATQWWGIWIMSIGAPYFWVAILGPIMITFLLRFVSGVPLAEKSMEKKEGFADYAKSTNIFVPWFKGK